MSFRRSTSIPTASRRICIALTAAILFVAGACAPRVPVDRFVTANGVKLHYVDWGGSGQVLLFLTPLGASAREYDDLAPEFTDQFRVLGVTRRGQSPSERPPSGYDTTTLADDVRGFLDALRIDRATLVGYSVAGHELSLFAGQHPHRVQKLVYLDAAFDGASTKKAADELARRFSFPPPPPPDDPILAAIVAGSEASDPDYSAITAPALAIYVIPDPGAYVTPPGVDESQAREMWEKFGKPMLDREMAHFEREMKNRRVVKLDGTDHNRFLRDEKPRSIVLKEMRAFLIDDADRTPTR